MGKGRRRLRRVRGRMKRVGRMRRSVLADRVVAAKYRLDRRVGLNRFRSTIDYRHALSRSHRRLNG